MALAAAGDLAAARARLEKFPAELRKRLELEPTNAYMWERLGTMSALLGNQEEAVRCVRKAMELVPESLDAMDGANFHASLGFAYAWTGEKERALAEYAKVLPAIGGGRNVHTLRRGFYWFPMRGYPGWEAMLNDPKNNAPRF